MSRFDSWYPAKPGSCVVNAFSISCWDIKFYAFPPFSLIRRSLAKVQREEATGIMIVPLWSTQAWFLLMLRLLVAHPRFIPPHKGLLQLPGQKNLVHPLYKQLALLAIHIFRQMIGKYTLPASTVHVISHSWRGGTRSQYDSVKFCIGGKINPTCPSIEEIRAYLTHMYEDGMQYNCIYKKCIANVLALPEIPYISAHPLKQRSLKGVYNLHPPNPRYCDMGHHHGY